MQYLVWKLDYLTLQLAQIDRAMCPHCDLRTAPTDERDFCRQGSRGFALACLCEVAAHAMEADTVR